MTGKIKPVVFTWSGNEMVPLPRFKRMCDMQFVVGEQYPLAMVETRSRASHNHYFAAVHEAWSNLPESVASYVDEQGEIHQRWQTAEHLRKWALIETGWCGERTFACESEDHALRLCSYLTSHDEYAVVSVDGSVVKIFEAKSQAAHAMGKEAFEQSKRDVLDRLTALVDVKLSTVKKEGNRHFPEKAR